MGAKIQQSVACLLTEDEFWVGPDSVQNTGPGCKPELGKTLSTTIVSTKTTVSGRLCV
jgi:hypothetical protein